MNKIEIKLKPIRSYRNGERSRSIIFKENKNKSGIYRWTNLINKKSYVGSANNLSGRLINYFSPFLKKEFLKGGSKLK